MLESYTTSVFASVSFHTLHEHMSSRWHICAYIWQDEP